MDPPVFPGLARGNEERFPFGQPDGVGDFFESDQGQGARFSRARRDETEPFRRIRELDQHGAPVGRERQATAISQADRGRPIHLTEIDGCSSPAGFADLVEQDRLPVGGEIERLEPVDDRVMSEEHAAVARDVVELELARHLSHQPQLSPAIDGVEPARFSRLGRSGEPDLLTVERPAGSAARQVESPDERARRAASSPDDHHRPAVVIEERDLVASRGEPWRPDLPSFVQDFPDRELEPYTPAHAPNDRELLAAGRKIGSGIRDVLDRRPGGPAGERDTGQGSEGADFIYQNRHFAGARDRQNVRVHAERAGFGTLRTNGIQPSRLTAERCAVDDRLAVRREAGVLQRGGAERQALESGRGGPGNLLRSDEPSGDGTDEEQKESRRENRGPPEPAEGTRSQ